MTQPRRPNPNRFDHLDDYEEAISKYDKNMEAYAEWADREYDRIRDDRMMEAYEKANA